MDDNKTSIADLSEEFGVPRTFIERALKPEMIKLMDVCWKLITIPEIKRVVTAAE